MHGTNQAKNERAKQGRKNNKNFTPARTSINKEIGAKKPKTFLICALQKIIYTFEV